MKLIIGLGNPGLKYDNTRHNFGFMALDQFASSVGASWCEQSRFKAATAELNTQGEKYVLVKPLTFMNLSGDAVGAFMRFYKVEPQDMWVIADDLDLPLGKIRVRNGGASGGHNGLEDIIAKCATGEFWRIRLGIRGDAAKNELSANGIATRDFVLGKFTEREGDLVQNTLNQTLVILKEGITHKNLTARTYDVNGVDTRVGQ